jgi:hypothetical protein
MNRVAALALRLVARALPARDRDAVVGDVVEQAASRGLSPVWAIRELGAVVAHYQVECYALPADRLRAGVLASAALAVLWSVPIATATLFAGPDVFTDPLSSTIVEFWRAAHVSSALAAGLVAGGAPLLAPHAQAVRWHVALVLAGASLAQDASWLAVVALLAAVWVASRAMARDEPPAVSGT